MTNSSLFGSSRTNILLLIDITFLVYLSTLASGFSSLDDTGLMESLQKGALTLSSLAPGGGGTYFRPLTLLTYIVDFHLWGANPVAFHFTNVVIHIVNACLVYNICSQYLSSNDYHKLFSLIAALFFALNPVNSESVLWVSGRTDLICCFFFLATITILLNADLSPINSALALFVTFFCSLLAKESSIALAGIVPLFLIFKQQPKSAEPRKYICSALIIACAAYLYMRQGPGVQIDSGMSKMVTNTINQSTNFLVYKSVTAIGFYSKKLLWPYPLNFAIHDLNQSLYFPAGILAIIVTIFCFVRFKTVRFPLLIIAASLIPPLLALLGSIPWTLYAERYLYIPMTGIALIVAIILAKCHSIPKTLPLLLIIPLALSTMHRVGQWAQPVALWQDTVSKSPGFPQARVIYVYELIQEGRITEAEKQIKIIRSMNYENKLLLKCIAAIKRETNIKDIKPND